MKTIGVMLGVLAAVAMIALVAWHWMVSTMVNSTSNPDWVEAKIHDRLAPLPELLREDPTGARAQTYLGKQRLGDAILTYFYGVPGALHEHSPARQVRVEAVERWLLPHEADLIELLKASAPHAPIPNAVAQLCYWAKPTPTLRDALLEVARSPKSDYQKAAEAYETVILLQLDDNNIRAEMMAVVRRGLDRDSADRESGLASMVLGIMTRFALPEIAPLCRELLSVPYKAENVPGFGGWSRLLSKYCVAAQGLATFGTLAAADLPLLRSRLAEMDPAGDGDALAILRLREAIEIVEGKRIPKLAINWKGQFLGGNQAAQEAWYALHPKSPPVAATSPIASPAGTPAAAIPQ